MLDVYIGYDPREHAAYEVACKTLCEHSSQPVKVHTLRAPELYAQRLLWRPVEYEGGRMRDHLSGSYQSTEFAVSRFLVPTIQKTGWALFIDLDMLVLSDIAELFALADDRYAVMCVKHGELPSGGTKMDNQPQLGYRRKNWSSVMLFNCDHLAHLRMSLPMINHWPGLLLHQFAWLRDEEIGALPPEYNWLVGVEPRPQTPKIAHYTLGGPWLPGWKGAEHDDLWMRYAK